VEPNHSQGIHDYSDSLNLFA